MCPGSGAAGGESDQQCCGPAQSGRSPAQSLGVHLHWHPALRSDETPPKLLNSTMKLTLYDLKIDLILLFACFCFCFYLFAQTGRA